MNPVLTIPALGDNYIYLYQCTDRTAFVIDPGDSTPVLKALEAHSLTLSAALITHAHYDHCGGARDLKKNTDCQIIGPTRAGIPGIDRILKPNETIEVANTKIEVIPTPGHTETSVCYHIQPADTHPGIIFTGDTLFTGGCGRLFESDAQTMWKSLQIIAALPDDTLIYPGHNYTKENYQFALTIEPENETIAALLHQSDFTPPSTIIHEKKTNIFLKAPDPKTFAQLRQRKDNFG